MKPVNLKLKLTENDTPEYITGYLTKVPERGGDIYYMRGEVNGPDGPVKFEFSGANMEMLYQRLAAARIYPVEDWEQKHQYKDIVKNTFESRLNRRISEEL